MNNKEKYHNFCQTEKIIPIFSQDWFLDAVCGKDNWDVAIFEKGGKVVGSLPYYKKRKYFIFSIITMPKHIQNMGVYIKYPPQKQRYEKKLVYEKEIMYGLIEQLPKVDYYNQAFHYRVTNWLPFYLKGYDATTKYTYVIEDLSNLDEVYRNFSNAKRKDIEKASRVMEVKFDLDAKRFYEHHKESLATKGDTISYSFEHFECLYRGIYKYNQGRTIYAIDKESQKIAAAFLYIWDSVSGYHLINTIDNNYRNSGVGTLLLWEIIKDVSKKCNRFDFEGSMVESIEKSYRQFGTRQKPYFDIRKVDSKILKPLVML